MQSLENLHKMLYASMYGDSYESRIEARWQQLLMADERIFGNVETPRQYVSFFDHLGLPFYRQGIYHATRKLIDSGRYSRYEDPTSLLIIDQTWNDIRPFFSEWIQSRADPDSVDARDGMNRLDNMIVGTFDHGQCNALAVKIGRSENYIVLLNTGLITFISRMARILMYAVAVAPEAAFRSLNFKKDIGLKTYRRFLRKFLTLPENRNVIDGAVAAVREYFGSAEAAEFDHLQFSREERIFSEMMIYGAEAFVLAHECAHALLGHLDGQKDMTVLRNALGAKAIQYDPERDEEIEADSVAMSAMLTTGMANSSRCGNERTQSYYYSYFTLGAHLFFESIRIIEEHSYGFTGEKSESGSHPPTDLRIKFATEHCREIGRGHQLPGIRKMKAEFGVLRELIAERINADAQSTAMNASQSAK